MGRGGGIFNLECIEGLCHHALLQGGPGRRSPPISRAGGKREPPGSYPRFDALGGGVACPGGPADLKRGLQIVIPKIEFA